MGTPATRGSVLADHHLSKAAVRGWADRWTGRGIGRFHSTYRSIA